VLLLTQTDYSLIISIFFIGYTLFEVPSNLILAKMRPSVYLNTIMAVWGVCVAAMSQCKTREHLLIGRFFLGCIEAGLFPGALYLLTCWYTKGEIGWLNVRTVNPVTYDSR
jgi:MFS family permease